MVSRAALYLLLEMQSLQQDVMAFSSCTLKPCLQQIASLKSIMHDSAAWLERRAAFSKAGCCIRAVQGSEVWCESALILYSSNWNGYLTWRAT